MTVTVRIDPHVHSDESYDGSEPIELILEHAADIGLDGVVITDHDVMSESLRAADLASEYGLIGIPGVEVSTAHGHLLAIGVDEMPPHRASFDETVAWIRDRGGVAVVPHPFQRSRHGVRKRHIEDCDAVEVFNAWLFTGYRNRKARRFAETSGYPGIAASDAHTLEYVGRAFTEIEIDTPAGGTDVTTGDVATGDLTTGDVTTGDVTANNVTATDVLDAIRSGETGVNGRRAPVPMAAKHYTIAATRKSGYYAKKSAVTSAYYTKKAALTSASAAKISALQGAHRLNRAMSWLR